jgi:uncharacterized repeat protein (TIGR03803 family)
MDSSGDLYGTTYGGGASNSGTVFELPGAAADTSFQFSGLPSSRSAGASQTFIVTLQDAGGAAGAVDFTSTDGSQVLTANEAFTALDICRAIHRRAALVGRLC